LSRESLVSFIHPDEPVPGGLRNDEFVLRPITAADAEMDYRAVMETRRYLRLWEQSSWPADDFTVDANREDLVGLEKRHLAHRAFTYTVVDPAGTECLGCVYVFPTTATFLAKSAVTAVGDDDWSEVEAVIYFWARLSHMELGLDGRLLDALRAWFATEWKVARAVYVTNEQFRHQVDLIDRTDLVLKFTLLEPDKPGTYLVFG
jgi:hypothetical protein